MVTSKKAVAISEIVRSDLIFKIFIPFACGYFLSYLFRTINATVAGVLTAELGVEAGELGLLTAAYFLTFAAAQLPIGIALDRYGPRRVQAGLLCIAALGALIFAHGTGLASLFAGRALIGFGVAGALLAGLKANAEYFPPEKLPLLNGVFIAAGASGAVAATMPVNWLLAQTDWRTVFELLAALTLGVAGVIFSVSRDLSKQNSQPVRWSSFGMVYGDRRFWRLAPLSAVCIGSAWALQGLWAAPWLADVTGLDRPAVMRHLFLMAVTLCAGAVLMGLLAGALKRRGISIEAFFSGAAMLLIAAELSLLFRLPVPPLLAWCIISAMGAMTVLSFAILGRYFGKDMAGRANGALSIMHIGGAFLIQSGIGMIIGAWPQDASGHYPEKAYSVALAVLVFLQAAALCQFVWGGETRKAAVPAEA